MMLKGLKITLLHIVSAPVSIGPLTKYTLFIHKRHFYKQRQAEIGKNLSKAKQHPVVELLINMSKKQVCLY